jgi:hypothetical protein
MMMAITVALTFAAFCKLIISRGKEWRTAMIEHTHWRGPTYCMGVGGQKLAIVGYSHYLQRGATDDNNCTTQTVKDVLDGGYSLAFFNLIAGYFGMDLEFWNHVVFFNFLPTCIGFEDDKFREGTAEQTELGKVRALKVMNAEKPDKVLVFTQKGWHAFPKTDEETAKLGGTTPLGDSFPPEFRWGTYRLSGYSVTACGLRHPQGADGQTMRQAVRTIMAMPQGFEWAVR